MCSELDILDTELLQFQQDTSGERAGVGDRREGQLQAEEDGAEHALLGQPLSSDV